MTIPEIVSFLQATGLLGALVVFVAGTYYKKLMWTHQHEAIVKLHEQRFADLERQKEATEADLRQQLVNAIKRGDEWQDMTLQQRRTVDKSLEVIAVSAEKSTK
jgi:hypothetical protein